VAVMVMEGGKEGKAERKGNFGIAAEWPTS